MAETVSYISLQLSIRSSEPKQHHPACLCTSLYGETQAEGDARVWHILSDRIDRGGPRHHQSCILTFEKETIMTDPSSKMTENLKDHAKATAADLGDTARQAARDTAGAVREEATRRAEGARSGMADEVSDIASALRKAADEMRHGSPQERTLGQIAGGLADMSDAIRDKDLGEMLNEISGFARRNPWLFLSGMALTGFAATRFATASARRNTSDIHRDTYRRDTYRRDKHRTDDHHTDIYSGDDDKPVTASAVHASSRSSHKQPATTVRGTPTGGGER